MPLLDSFLIIIWKIVPLFIFWLVRYIDSVRIKYVNPGFYLCFIWPPPTLLLFPCYISVITPTFIFTSKYISLCLYIYYIYIYIYIYALSQCAWLWSGTMVSNFTLSYSCPILSIHIYVGTGNIILIMLTHCNYYDYPQSKMYQNVYMLGGGGEFWPAQKSNHSYLYFVRTQIVMVTITATIFLNRNYICHLDLTFTIFSFCFLRKISFPFLCKYVMMRLV